MGIKVTEADRWFSRAVRHNAGHQCEHCGVTDRKLEAAHLYGRRSAVTRWDLLNATCLCHTCHRTFSEDPRDFTKWVESEWPGRWAILDEKRRHLVKNNAATRAEVSKHYREALRAAGDGQVESWI